MGEEKERRKEVERLLALTTGDLLGVDMSPPGVKLEEKGVEGQPEDGSNIAPESRESLLHSKSLMSADLRPS